MRSQQALAGAALAAVLVAACSGDDEPATSRAAVTTAAPTASSVAPPGALTTDTDTTAVATATTSVTSTSSVAVSSTSAPPTAAPPSTPLPSTPSTSTPTSEPATPTTVDPRTAASSELDGSLPTASDLGLPSDWSVRDLPAGNDEASIPRSELDPFRNVVTCPADLTAFAQGGPWAERKLNGVDPSDDGVLIIRVQLVREDEAGWRARQRVIDRCEAASVDAFVDREPSIVAVGPAEDVGVERLSVFSSATGDAPFPSQVVFVAAHLDGVTAMVTYFGLNEADEFDDAALELLSGALADATR